MIQADDRNAIIEAVNLYAFAVDTQRWDLFDQVFAPDIKADFGGGAVWNDLASFKRDFATVHGPFQSTQHTVTNHVLAAEGADAARCLSYVHGRFVREVGEGGNMFESAGWYDDRLVRTDGGWRIAERVCRMIWAAGNPAVLETLPGVTASTDLRSLRGEADAGRIAFLERASG